ncbi:hypothetical protein HYH02_009129 [Chlamydomonas schloesseri]|uniref:Peptidase S54 rhomboid domain-containing protein n=1 Tax=Chlamydomonas schloesseri TaxID=2026947 RepID=A0A835WB78_9CHLO|nr:hypothetical protein HYH02_009129 [Chlamydomonas schloesseri]|eukprot:KAG2444191.1 hypothetical protein HYH02_009129 [Chlamydomonas schloesseri]
MYRRRFPVPPPGGYGGYGGGYGHNPRNSYAMILALQLANQIYQLEDKPPVTLALLALQVVLFFGRGGGLGGLIPPELARYVNVQLAAVCLQPREILERGDWKRLLLPAFLHVDEHHLFYNMGSLLWKGVQLEGRYGHWGFAALVAELLLLSHGATVLLAAALAELFPGYRYLYWDTCAVGFSAVLFALKVVLNYNQPGNSSILGLELPTKYLCWAELVLASYLTPQACFIGHLGGILAGLAHVRLVEPALRAAGWRLPRGGGGAAPPQMRGGNGMGGFGFGGLGGLGGFGFGGPFGPAPFGGGLGGGVGAAPGGRPVNPEPGPAPQQPRQQQYFNSGGRLGGEGSAARGPAAAVQQQEQQQQRQRAQGTSAGPSSSAGAAGVIPPRPRAPLAPPAPQVVEEPSAPPMPTEPQPTAPSAPPYPATTGGIEGTAAARGQAPQPQPHRGGDGDGGSRRAAAGAVREQVAGPGVGAEAEPPARPSLTVEQLRQRRLERFG